MYKIISEIRNYLSKDAIFLNSLYLIFCIDISDNFNHKDTCDSCFNAMALVFNSFKGEMNGKIFITISKNN